jgi:hypothetical protein
MNAGSEYPTPPTRTKTCSYCKRGGFVWYFTKGHRWMLAEPKPRTLIPDPKKVHICPVLAERKARAVIHQKSYKPSTWRRGKSPGSYG